MKLDHFPTLILIGRPASGKSEIIDHLQKTSLEKRLRKYHISELIFFDDFPMLWTWFEEDWILDREFGKPRLHTDENGYFKYPYLWNLLIRRIGLEYEKSKRDIPDFGTDYTALIEFSRGSEHGGYREAFQHLPIDLLKNASIIYIHVSYEESLRKNRRRFNPDKPDSILEHSLPDEKLERLYKEDDWFQLVSSNPQYLELKGIQVPYAIFENEDDVTTNKPELLESRLSDILDRLWQSRNKKMD